MKRTIKGITYDTEQSRQIADLGGDGYDMELYQDGAGRLFGHERRFRIDGRLTPKGKDTHAVLPALSSKNPVERAEAETRITQHERIIPFSRRQALHLCIRLNIPRTFHKDLARYLK